MAPEQKSKDCQFDERTDIYGLGALLRRYAYWTTGFTS